LLLASQSHSAPSTCPQWTDRESLNLARSLFAYALDSEYLEKTPLYLGSSLARKATPGNNNHRSTEMTWNKFLIRKSISHVLGINPHSRFYIPLLALFTGSHLEEMASLHCEDVFQNQGLWCIEHNFNNGRKLKNKNAVRIIPLHPLKSAIRWATVSFLNLIQLKCLLVCRGNRY